MYSHVIKHLYLIVMVITTLETSISEKLLSLLGGPMILVTTEHRCLHNSNNTVNFKEINRILFCLNILIENLAPNWQSSIRV